MAANLLKVVLAISGSLLGINWLLQNSPEIASAFDFLADATYSFYSSHQPYTSVGTFASLAFVIGMLIARRSLPSSNGHFYAPRGKIELDKAELKKFDATITVISKGHVLENTLRRVLEKLSQGRQEVPIWIRLSRETLAKSYLTGEEKLSYDISILGKKSLLDQLLTDLHKLLETYSQEDRIRILKSDPPLNSLDYKVDTFRDSIALPKNIKLKKIKAPSWALRVILAIAATAAAFILLVKLFGRSTSKEKAVEIALTHLESVHGVKPVLKDVQEHEKIFLVDFETHSITVDKRTGKILKVSRK